jgi:small subunit ribosomal protein S14
MTASDWNKILKQLEGKPEVKAKFLKHCKPKERKTGIAAKKCERCGRFGAHIKSYGLNLCRHCFREIATEIGFTKYS